MPALTKKRRRFLADTALSFTAYGIPLVVAQVVVLPALARVVDAEENGLILSLVALLNLLPSTLGNALNNIRLLDGNGVDDSADDRSFRCVLLWSTALDALAIMALTWFYSQSFGWNMILMVATASLMLVQEYLKAEYRITLDFKAIALNAIILSAGYLLGYPLFIATGNWGSIYFVAQFLSTSYVFLTTGLWRGPIGKGPQFQRITLDYVYLFGSSLLARAVTYADRLLLYPLMGGYSVSVYYAASLLGKLISTVVTPINSVMLSYLARMNTKPKRLFKLVCLACGGVCMAAYAVTIVVSRPLLSFIYPQYAEDALSLVWVTTAAAYLTVVASVLNPFVLKFSNIRYQLIINGSYLAVYVASSLIFLRFFGLMGFCIGSLSASAARVFALMTIYVLGDSADKCATN